MAQNKRVRDYLAARGMSRRQSDMLIQPDPIPEPEPTPPKQPILIIAPNQDIFRRYCAKNNLSWQGNGAQAHYITEPWQLIGVDPAELLVLGYKEGRQGWALRDMVMQLQDRAKTKQEQDRAD